MEDSLVITGGTPLSGEVRVSGAKNIALKVLTAALLFDGEVILENIPRIGDVAELMNLITVMGAQAEFTGHNIVRINPAPLTASTLDLLYASRIRTSFMFFAPLLHRFREAHIPNPGGCRLGARPIDRIIDGMRALGVEVEYDSGSGYFHATMHRDPAGSFRFPKVSHTGTELLIMLAAISSKTTIIENAALEPEIDDLIAFLNQGGARIVRNGSTVTVTGVSSLKQKHSFGIANDRNEASTYAVMALATKGSIVVRGVNVSQLESFDDYMRRIGGQVDRVDEESIRYSYTAPLRPIEIETGPHPGFMTDWQPPVAVALTQAHGTSTIHERMFENRFSYVGELHKLGADIEYYTPEISDPAAFYAFNYSPGGEYRQAIRINGPSELHNAVLSIADLRAGATLAIGALIASGESVIRGAAHLERGYEDFVGKVRSLGGNIKKV
ncbi:MAG: UDP-N-acetylglucosamine 1-carboxyvinyltransferase [Patescibacteria group bacterium]|nr:UDP-N-acetylglucosamine 1-carboxyvinyltransferase [Patescibacteria group bacterium]